MGLDWYDYGARFYDAALGRFSTQDMFAENYHFMSPYHYCANNPIYNIDENGDSIRVYLGGNAYVYRYTNELGYGFYDDSGELYLGDDIFINAVGFALANLMLGGEEGLSLVNDIAFNTLEYINILPSFGFNGRSFAGEDNGQKYIRWNINDFAAGFDQKSSTKLDPFYKFIILGHELAHTQDKLNGTLNSNKWVSIQTEEHKWRDIPFSELYATHVENKLRAEWNLPLRTNYSPDDQGNPVSSTSILKGNYSKYVDQYQTFQIRLDSRGKIIYKQLNKNQIPYNYKSN